MRLMVNAVGLLQISLLYNYWRTAEVTFYNAYTCQGADAVYREADNSSSQTNRIWLVSFELERNDAVADARIRADAVP